MTSCHDCARDLNRYNPACLECGRRYLRAIQRLRLPEEEKVAWLRRVLADWMKYGHAEADLRGIVLRSGGAPNTPATNRRNH